MKLTSDQAILADVLMHCLKDDLKPDECLKIVASRFTEFLQLEPLAKFERVPHTMIIFRDGDGEFLNIVATTADFPRNTRLMVSRCVSGLVFKELSSPYIVCDPEREFPELFQDYLGPHSGASIKTELVVPACWQGKRFAVINLEATVANCFSPEHIQAALNAAELLSPLLFALQQRVEKSKVSQIAVLSALDSYLGHVAATYAHKTLAPLSGFAVELDTLEERIGNTEEEVRASFGRLRSNVRTLTAYQDAFCADITGFSRFSSISLGDILNAALGIFRPQSRKRGGGIEIVMNKNEDYHVYSSLFLKEVFRNIVENAYYWTQKRLDKQANPPGLIEVSLDGVPPLANEPESELNKFCRVRIRDNGMGMESEELKKLFEPGYTTRPEGTGYGLYAAKEFVTALGGQIQAASSPGQYFEIQILFRVMSKGRQDIQDLLKLTYLRKEHIY